MSTPTDREVTCFEAGIKFGSLYHQFAGTPVTEESAPSLERAMERAIENQPHCVDVQVSVDTDAVAEAVEATSATYTELTGTFLDVTLTVEYENVRVIAEMKVAEEYPLMTVTDVIHI